MLVDAIRRREPYYWLMIIFIIPFGSVIYFFMVKIKDYDLERATGRLQKPPSVARLRDDYQRTPSLDRLVSLAEGLTAKGESVEAVNLFREVLESEPDNPDALFGTGQAYVNLERYPEAIEVLSALVESNRGYRDYGAWPFLAFALYESGQKEECLSTLRRLYEGNPRLGHAILLAHYLIRAGAKGEARDLLTTSIDDHRIAPRFVRRGSFRSALEAKRMLKACAEGK